MVLGRSQSTKKHEATDQASVDDRSLPLSPEETKNKSPVKDIFRKIAYGNALYQFSLQGNVPDQLSVVPSDPWPGHSDRGRKILEGSFTYAGIPQPGDPNLWSDVGADNEEWVFWAHGFAWLRDLRSLGGDQARRKARSATLQWMENYDQWDPIIWRADVVGKRLSSILGMHDFFLASASDGFRQKVFDMILRQACHLSRTIESECKHGSAKIAALRGLIFSCLALDDLRPKLQGALQSLSEALRQQILSDGSHISRCPATHVRVLRHLIDTRHALGLGGIEVPSDIHQAIKGMMPVMQFFRQGDGHLALFNGSHIENKTIMDLMRNHAPTSGRSLKGLPHAGYERLSAGRALALLDAGRAPPVPYNMRSHKAPMSFEFSHGKERIIVNCGYLCAGKSAQALHKALRSTAAHSTLTVNDSNASCPNNTELKRSQNNDGTSVEGENHGYASRFGIVHRRQLSLDKDGLTLRGADTVEGEVGHGVILRFHLHPDCQALVTGQGSGVLIRTGQGHGWRFKCEGYQVALEESIYACSPDEPPQKTEQIVIQLTTERARHILRWALKKEQKV